MEAPRSPGATDIIPSMKVRDSGMPDEILWATFFDAPKILSRLDCVDPRGDVVEFGCGYGTFTIPAAQMTTGTVFAMDIDPAMIENTSLKARDAGLANVMALARDFVAEGTGLPDGCSGCALLFNILHGENPVGLLREAFRVLRPGGRVGIIHWIHDASTPRGPDLTIRPRPEQCLAWALEAGLAPLSPPVDLPPYHYGLVVQKTR